MGQSQHVVVSTTSQWVMGVLQDNLSRCVFLNTGCSGTYIALHVSFAELQECLVTYKDVMSAENPDSGVIRIKQRRLV